MTQPDAGESPGVLRESIAQLIDECVGIYRRGEAAALGEIDRTADRILALPELRSAIAERDVGEAFYRLTVQQRDDAWRESDRLRTALAGRTQGEPFGWVVVQGMFGGRVSYKYFERANEAEHFGRLARLHTDTIEIVPLYRATPPHPHRGGLI